MSSEALKESVILKDVLKKKGAKFGFWHKRLCKLTTNHLLIFKGDNESELDKTIEIGPDTSIQCNDNGKPPHFILHYGEGRPLKLCHDSANVIVTWVNEIRNISLQTPNISMNNFEIVSVLGRGFYGKVMLVKKKDTNEYYAIKTVHKNRLVKSNKVHTIFTERNILMKAKHPFIVNLCFAFQTETKVYLGLEYAAGGEMFFHLQNRGTIPIDEVRLYIAELSLALNYLHNYRIIYRDLKPENVLLDSQGHIKLTDFGLAKSLADCTDTTGTFCGTSEYVAPEIISRRPYGIEIDWWALGIFTYELLYGQTPFFNENRAKMFQSIKASKPRFPRKAEQSTIDFITMLLEKDPNQRGTFDKINGHPFFKGLNFEKVLAKKYKPAFIPPSNGIADNFDEEFTMENPQDSLATPTMNAKNNPFNGFSYVADGMENDDDDEDENDNSDNECLSPLACMAPTEMND